MRRSFSVTHTVRYDECNTDGVLTPAAFLRYMQDIAARDARDAYLEDGYGFWVVKRTVMHFAVPIAVHTRLELTTFGMGFTRITAQRGYEARLADQPTGAPLIVARTLWVYVDLHGRPTRLPEGTAQIWLPNETRAPQAEVAFPAVPERSPAIVHRYVSFSAIDRAQHLNNASAVDMLDDAAWETCARMGIVPETSQWVIHHYDIDYAGSLRFGEELTIETWFDPWPVPGGEWARIQQILHGGKVMVRAVSRWHWPG